MLFQRGSFSLTLWATFSCFHHCGIFQNDHRNLLLLRKEIGTFFCLTSVQLRNPRGVSSPFLSDNKWVFSSESNYASSPDLAGSFHCRETCQHAFPILLTKYFPKHAWWKHFNILAIFLILFWMSITTNFHFL